MRFEWPLALPALLIVPLLAALYVYRDRGRGARAADFASPPLLPNLVPRPPGRRRHVPQVVLLAALALLLMGVARPHATFEVPFEEATVVLVLDVSRSMTARDVRPTRLRAAQTVARTLLDEVPPAFNVGIVSFASQAAAAVPPTTDRDLARRALRSQRRGEGTALGDAVALSVRLARNRRSDDGRVPPTAILLISDGAQEGGRTTPAVAAAQARRLRIPVYTVLVGTPAGIVERPLPGGFREIVQVPASPETLQALARETGGRFFADRRDPDVRTVFERLTSRLGHRAEARELTDVFAGASAIVLLTGAALSTLWLRRVA